MLLVFLLLLMAGKFLEVYFHYDPTQSITPKTKRAFVLIVFLFLEFVNLHGLTNLIAFILDKAFCPPDRFGNKDPQMQNQN